jgi:hypothetical protein
MTIRPAIFDGDVPAVDPAQLAQSLAKGVRLRSAGGRISVADETDATRPCGLRKDRKRCGTESRDQRADKSPSIDHGSARLTAEVPP